MTTNEYTLLNSIVENTDMALHSITKIKSNKKVTNTEFLAMLENQMVEYQKINELASTIINASGEKVVTKNKMVKSISSAGINWEIMVDPTTSHLSQMLLQGMVMGEITIIKELNAKRGSLPPQTVELAEKLLTLHSQNAQDYKKYL